MMHARELTFALAASATLVVPALAEELDCRWFFPAIDRTLPVRCDEEVTPNTPPAPQQVRTERDVLGLTLAPLSRDLIDKYSIEKRHSATKDGHKTILPLLSNARGDTQSVSLSL